jgi:hypothetical protein
MFKTTDEKYNMVSARHGVILPQNVDEIRAFNDNCYVFPIINNEKRFYSMVTENAKTILPSQQGIPSKFIVSEKVYMTYNGMVRYIEITLGIDFRLYVVQYSPEENKILSIKDHTQWTTKGPVEPDIDPKIISQIEQLFFPDKAQIAEQFKNIMNRMNDL